MNTLVKETAVLALQPAADHTGKEGYFVEFSSGQASVSNSATDEVIGVIIDGETTAGRSSIALCGAFAGIVKVKLNNASASQGDFLVLHTDGTVKTDPGTGGRCRVARALEGGAANELINAVLMHPLALS